jgi:lantibiotic transport system permease protein
MTLSFIHSFQSELLKTKRSLALWIVIIGGFFTPAIVTIIRLVQYKTLPTVYASDTFWMQLWQNSWESMAIFMLPMGVVLATSLITQIEYKNNTWKQLHTTPLSLTTIFFSKLTVIVVMMFQFFVLFNMGIYLSAVIPYLLIGGVPYPNSPFPYLYFLEQNIFYFIDCLPIIALQYLISLKFKNFLVPVGAGFVFWVGALASLPWKYGYLIPYTYCMFLYLQGGVENKATIPTFNFHVVALGYFVVITAVSYVLYVTKKEKG